MSLGCKSAKRTEDGYYVCEVSGDACMYAIPNSKKCAEEWGEGPDAFPDDRCTNCEFYVLHDGKHCCRAEWAKNTLTNPAWWKQDDNSTELIDSSAVNVVDNLYLICDDNNIDEHCCGGFRKRGQAFASNILSIIRECIDENEKDVFDMTKEEILRQMTPKEIFEAYLNYEGFIYCTDKIIGAIKEIFGVDLDEISSKAYDDK